MPKRFFGTAAVFALITALAVPAAPRPVEAGFAGPYLAGRHASFETDFRQAVRYFERANTQDPGNPQLLEAITASYASLGEMTKAASFADKMIEGGINSQIAHLARMVRAAQNADFDTVLSQLAAGEDVGPLVDGLVNGWAELGRGDVNAALAAFDVIASERGLQGFANYHKALAMASVGDFVSAAAILESDTGAAQATRRGVMAHAQILSQLGRNDEALDLMSQMFTTRLDPGLAALKADLEAGNSAPFSVVTSPQDGMAEVYYTIGGVLRGEASDDYTLLYSRAAEALRPDHVDAILLSARILEDLQQYDLASDTYAKVPVTHSAYHAAAMGRADALRASGNVAGAVEALKALMQTHGDLPIVHTTLGDVLRQEKRFEEAVAAYDAAIEIYGAPAPGQWFVYFARAIGHERLGDWPKAEADFRQALDLNPDQPQVLNYLGYSLVEKKMKLDEALSMIERAVAARPDSGYIVDSLGWVLFRLGRYAEAVPYMERAAELMPIDPVVNDHLGDVYWSVGRKLEARFQWHRALSFIDHDENGEADPDRIRRKLDVGLDQVLEEEGLPPLKVANSE